MGFGKGKAKEVPEAIRKLLTIKRQMVRVPLREGEYHDIDGRHGAGKVVMRTAYRYWYYRWWSNACGV